MPKIRTDVTVELTDEQWRDAVKLARALGHDRDSASERELIKRLMRSAAQSAAWYAGEKIFDD